MDFHHSGWLKNVAVRLKLNIFVRCGNHCRVLPPCAVKHADGVSELSRVKCSSAVG